MLERGLIVSHLIFLSLLACYGLYRYYVLVLYYRVKAARPICPRPPASWPTVTIQIPVYNERYVVERAIRSACDVEYPKDRLEIQLLDDSTDDTSQIIARTLAGYRRQGLNVHHVQRAHRHQFKAGALAEGLRRASGELVAIFDVDFIVPRDLLTRTVPFLTDPSVGMVQARWGHVNAAYSFLTRVQAILLDGHFVIEQVARHHAGRFFSFNGTAGIWRAAAIRASGGWQADTLTEDLDLSYRAQLAGWRCVYLPALVASAELPVEMNAFKTQQYRWTKGSIQTAKKLLPRIFHSRLAGSIKAEALCHLTSYLSYPIGLLASLAFPLFIMRPTQLFHHWSIDLLWLILLAIPGACFYLCAQRELSANWLKRLGMIPWVVAVGIGMSVNNASAVVDAVLGGRQEFRRTPKFSIQFTADRWRRKQYGAPWTWTVWVELALAIYFAAGCLAALHRHLYLAFPSLALFCLGFAYVGGMSIWQRLPLPEWLLQPVGQRARTLPGLSA